MDMGKLIIGGFMAAFLLCGNANAADCERVNTPLSDGDILYAENYEEELDNLISCINARVQETGGDISGNLNFSSGDIRLLNAGDIKVYSDNALTLKFLVDGATGNITTSGTVDGVDISAHAADTTIHYTQSSIALGASQITSGTLPVARGGTGTTTSTGTGNTVLSASPTISSPNISGDISQTSSATTSNAMSITADSLATGSGVAITSNSSSSSTRYLANIVNDHASAVGATPLRLQQDAAGNLMTGVGASGATVFTLTYTGAASFSDNITISPTKRFYLDGGGDTFWLESGSNVANLYVGGAQAFQVQNNGTSYINSYFDFGVNSGKAVYYDGRGDTFDVESGPNIKDTYVGGNKWLSIDNANNYLVFRKDVNDYAVFDFYNLNNTSNAYVRNALVVGGSSAADPYTMWQVSGNRSYSLGIDNSDSDKLKLTTDPSGSTPSSGTTLMTINTAGEMLLPSVSTPTANYISQKSASKAHCTVHLEGNGTVVTPSIVGDNYNCSSVSVNVGGSTTSITINWGTDFASTNYTMIVTKGLTQPSGTEGLVTPYVYSKSSGSAVIKAWEPTTPSAAGVMAMGSISSIHEYEIVAWGDQ